MRRYISVVGGGTGRTYRVTRDRSSLSDNHQIIIASYSQVILTGSVIYS